MNIKEADKKKIIGLISTLQPDIKIYLFGSRARKTHEQGSDIDIAIISSKKLEPREIGEIRNVLTSSNLHYKIDIVDYNRATTNMKEMIDKEGILWKS